MWGDITRKKSAFIKNIPLEEKVGTYLSFDFSWWAMVGILSSDQIRPPTRPWCTCQTLISSPNLTINQYCRHAPRDPSSPQFPKDWIVTISTPSILHNSNSKVFPNILGLWQVAQTISYGKLWQDLALWAGGFPPWKDFLPGKISCQERFPGHFVGRRWKSRTQNTPKSAESVGIATSTYQRWHYSHLRKQYSAEKGHYLTDFLFAKAVFKHISQVFLVCKN